VIDQLLVTKRRDVVPVMSNCLKSQVNSRVGRLAPVDPRQVSLKGLKSWLSEIAG
jgi:hypothetical protein